MEEKRRLMLDRKLYKNRRLIAADMSHDPKVKEYAAVEWGRLHGIAPEIMRGYIRHQTKKENVK